MRAPVIAIFASVSSPQQATFDVLWCRARDRLGRTDALIAQVEALATNAGADEVYSTALPHQLGQSNEASAIYLSAIERAAARPRTSPTAAVARWG